MSISKCSRASNTLQALDFDVLVNRLRDLKAGYGATRRQRDTATLG